MIMKFEVGAVLPIPVLHVPMLRPHSNSIYLHSSSDSVARGSELQTDLASSEFATVVVGKSSFTVSPSRQANVRYFGFNWMQVRPTIQGEGEVSPPLLNSIIMCFL